MTLNLCRHEIENPIPRPKLNTGLARQFLESLYGRYNSQAKGQSYLEVRGRRETDPPGKMPFNRFYSGIAPLLKDMEKGELPGASCPLLRR
jgi:hypothetical protein